MKIRKTISVLMTCLLIAGSIGGNAAAVDQSVREEDNLVISRAFGEFRMSVKGKSTAAADSSFPLEAGDTVTVKASYSPFNADVDCGLIAPDGIFYGANSTNGSIDFSFKITERGNYTLAVYNNSSVTVSVSGFVSY